jgi:putative ABC transport system ATP-binding protein
VRAVSFGFIFQTFNLVPAFSAHENVEAALHPLGVRHAERTARVAAALNSAGPGDRAQHLPGQPGTRSSPCSTRCGGSAS